MVPFVFRMITFFLYRTDVKSNITRYFLWNNPLYRTDVFLMRKRFVLRDILLTFAWACGFSSRRAPVRTRGGLRPARRGVAAEGLRYAAFRRVKGGKRRRERPSFASRSAVFCKPPVFCAPRRCGAAAGEPATAWRRRGLLCLNPNRSLDRNEPNFDVFYYSSSAYAFLPASCFPPRLGVARYAFQTEV